MAWFFQPCIPRAAGFEQILFSVETTDPKMTGEFFILVSMGKIKVKMVTPLHET
jgi:hypothetical protein